MNDLCYFPHDANKRNSPNICEMRAVYGMQGYGWYWVLVEMLRESPEGRLKLCKCNAYAMQMQCTVQEAQKFIDDCIHEFDLFSTDGIFFWDEDLTGKMSRAREISEKRKKAANVKWGKASTDENTADLFGEECTCNANAEQMQDTCTVKESKVNNNTINSIISAMSKTENQGGEEPLEEPQKIQFPAGSVQYETALTLRNAVKAAIPHAQVPQATEKGLSKWAGTIDLMIRRDNITPDKMSALIAWLSEQATENAQFWSTTVQSADGFRKHFAKMSGKYELDEKRGNTVGNKKQKTDIMELVKKKQNGG